MADIIAIGGSFGSANSFGGTYYGVIEQQVLKNYLLVVDNALHGHTADSVSVTQQHTLVVSDALHAHTVNNVTIVQQHTLAVADALHSLTFDNVNVIYNIPLIVADSLHGHTTDSVTITQQHTIAVDNALHYHTIDNVTVVQQHSLVVNDTTHGLTFDGSLVLNQFLLMNKPDDAYHGTKSDNVAISANQIILVDNASHRFLIYSPGIINWSDLDFYFGGYIPGYGNYGSLTAAQLAELRVLYSNLLIQNGSLDAVEVELGIHRAKYGETGELLAASLLTGILIPDIHNDGLLVPGDIFTGNITGSITDGGLLLSNRPNRILMFEDGFLWLSENGLNFIIEEDGNKDKINTVSNKGIFKQGFIEYGQF